MVTDNERREVARRLREYVDLPDDWWADTYSGFYVEKCAFGNVERHRESELFARLADLIEPSIPADPGEAGLACVDAFIREHTEKPVDRDTPQKVAEEMFGKMRHSTKEEADAYDAMLKSKSVEIHPVDRDALLALADDIDKQTDGSMFDAWLEDGHYIARRIREACGKVGR